MTAYLQGPDVHVAGFTPSGDVFARHVPLPLATDIPDAYVETVNAVGTFSPLDYLVVYSAGTPGGPLIRVARVQLTPL